MTLNPQTVADAFEDEDLTFEELLEAADSYAESDFELEFVASLKTSFEKYGDKTYLSDRQLATLKKIAKENL